MSGHSHWKSIKYQKTAADAKRSQAFSKLAREITVAAREKGGNPEFNPVLRIAIEKARSINMSTDNIERAIKRGTGEIGGATLEEITLEAYGPGGIAIIIEGITDNRNRTFNEIKQILNQYNGKLVESGSVKWLFERRGCIVINLNSQIEDFKNREKLEMLAIEAGVEDIYWHDEFLDVYTKIEDLENVKKSLEEKEVKIESSSLDWVAKEEIQADNQIKEVCQKLFEALDESDSVQEIYSNLKM